MQLSKTIFPDSAIFIEIKKGGKKRVAKTVTMVAKKNACSP
jgi:hypothetical protein